MLCSIGSTARREHHLRCTERVQRQQAHSGQPARRGDPMAHGIRNIVKLQIEKDAEAHPRERAHHGRAFGCKELIPNLDHPDMAAKPSRQGARVPGAVEIKGDDYSLGVEAGREGTSRSSRRTFATPRWSNPRRRATS